MALCVPAAAHPAAVAVAWDAEHSLEGMQSSPVPTPLSRLPSDPLHPNATAPLQAFVASCADTRTISIFESVPSLVP